MHWIIWCPLSTLICQPRPKEQRSNPMLLNTQVKSWHVFHTIHFSSIAGKFLKMGKDPQEPHPETTLPRERCPIAGTDRFSIALRGSFRKDAADRIPLQTISPAMVDASLPVHQRPLNSGNVQREIQAIKMPQDSTPTSAGWNAGRGSSQGRPISLLREMEFSL